MDKAKLLIVDDEKIALKSLEKAMKKEGYDVTATHRGPTALKLMQEREFDVVLTDLKMDKVDGMEILRRCRRLYPDSEVVMITGFASLDGAVDTMKKGAYHYISKPIKLDEMKQVVKEALEKIKLKKENTSLREQIAGLSGKIKIITQDAKFQKLLETARQIGPTDCNVVITGESGTDKELFARYIHFNSKRTEEPFYAVNCGAFTEELLTNELFGHEKGAFTGATALKKGLIEMASQGTLFLDGITRTAPAMQVKLLRVIQEKEVLRVGGTKPIKVDVRFIAATNRDIKKSIKTGQFRENLFFRLNVVSFELPSLSERREDIPLLCHYFLKKYSTLMNKSVTEISPEVVSVLINYDFPGNVRELENIIERGVALSNTNTIDVSHIPEDLRKFSIRTFRKKKGRILSLGELEMDYIKWVLKDVGGNKTLAAQILEIDRVSLWRKLKKYGLETEKNADQ